MKTKTKQSFKVLCEESGYKVYVDTDVINNIPQKQKGIVETFTLGRYVTDDELEKEYTSRGLIPADSYTVFEYHKSNDVKYLSTHWKDSKGKWCFATFSLWDGGRSVNVGRNVSGWDGNWWFAGLRKNLSTKPSESQNSLETESLALRIKKLEETVEKITKVINIT